MVASASAQTAYRDDARGWSTTLPPGWVIGPDSLVERANAELHKRMPDPRFAFIGAFVLSEPPADAGDVPYVLVQFNAIPLRGLTYEEISKGMGVDFSASAQKTISDKFSDIVKSAAFDQAIFDRALNRYVLTSRVQVDGAAPSRTLSTGYLTAAGVVQFNCYAPEATYPQYEGGFTAIIDGVRIDAGRVFLAADPSVRLAKTFNNTTAYIVIGAFVGLLVAGVFKVVRIVRNR